MICGNPSVGSGPSWRPWIEFYSYDNPFAFCGYGGWTPPAGDFIYQNMSYQTSSSEAYFFLENETTGVAHSCSLAAPPGWTFDGNTAEWVGETSAGIADYFNAIGFSDANAELGSSGSWVTLGSRTLTQEYDGLSLGDYCIAPGGVGSDQQSFTDTWYGGDCW